MAYGLLLYKEIGTPQGIQRIEILKDGYAGSAVEMAGLHADGLTISKDSSDLAQAITTSVLTIALSDCGEVDYSQFFTPNSTLYKVVWKMDGSPRWTGFITPDSFTENLAYRDTLTLTARDNLGRLNDYDFSLAKGQMVSVRDIINEGLSVAGVAMNTVFVTTKVATSPASTLAIDGLVNTTLLVGRTWHEALSLLLEGLGLTLAWNDANKFEVRDLSQAPANNQAAFFIQKSGYRQIRPAWKNFSIDQSYGLRGNFYEGQFSKDDCGGTGIAHRTFTIPEGSKWSGGLTLLNPYNGAASPYETIFLPVGNADTMTDKITYAQWVPNLDRPITLTMKCCNSAFGTTTRPALSIWAQQKLPYGTSQGQTVSTLYALRYRLNVFIVVDGVRYILRESWIPIIDAPTLEEPYLYFSLPSTETGVDTDEEIKIYIGEVPGSGELQIELYKPLAYVLQDDGSSPFITYAQTNAYGRLTDIGLTVVEGTAGRAKQIAINADHNIQAAVGVQVGQVPTGVGNALLYLGGLFYDDDDLTPLTGFARAANGTNYDLLELVGREYISYSNAAYNALSGTMRTASAAFRFDKSVTYDGNAYRVVGASLSILSNTLSAQLLQQEAAFDTTAYTITDVDTEGRSTITGGTGNIPQGQTNTANMEAVLVLSEGLAKAYARLTSLEDWLKNPALDELCLDYIGIAKRLNVGGMEVEYDAENNAWHLIGNLYADGWISAGGVNSSGGGGGGGIDLGAMWTSLRNTPTQTSDVTSTTKIALDHLPYTAGDGISISNAGAIALSSTGVAAGTYNSVTVDVYGRVTAGELVPTEDTDDIFAEGLAKAYARIGSLEDWLRDPSLDDLYVQTFGAGTVDAAGLLTVGGAANITGLLTASGEVKIAGTTKKLWFGDGIYIELDTNGYLHTNAAFYADGFISAGGLGSGGSGGGLDLGAMWTSLCNTAIPTGDVDANTKIAVAHLPVATASSLGVASFGTGLAISEAGAVTLATSGVTAGTYTTVTVDAYGRVTAGSSEQGTDVELALAEGIATVAARAGSLEDWLRDPALDTLQVEDFGAAVATVNRIYIGKGFIEWDADGYFHASGPFYSDEWISAGGVNSGGTGSVDLGAVWTSLCNTPMTTADVTSTTKIALAHLPYSAGDGISIGNTGQIALASTGVQAGTYAAVTVDVYGRVTAGSAPAALAFGSKSYDGTTAQTLTAADIGALTAHQTIYGLTINNASGTAVLGYNPASGAGNLTLTKAMVGLDNVENTALSTWYGSTYIRTVGTITYGTWHGSPISNSYLENSSITLAGTSVSLGGSLTAAQLRSLLSINNVENIALSTWGGSGYIRTVGTITSGTWHGDKITNSYINTPNVTIAGLTINLGGEIYDYQLKSALGITSVTSDIETLESYFTNGVANSAARLADNYSKTAWGQTYWSSGVPLNVSGAMTGVDSVNGFLYLTNNNSRLGVGTSSPTSTLHVAGGAYVTGSVVTDSFVYIGGTSAYIQKITSGLHTNVGFSSDGYITAGGVGSSSDARLKADLRDIDLTVAQIAAAPAVSFRWVATPSRGAGSIAQYWRDLLPENVLEDEDGYLNMQYGNIALLSAITIARAVETQEQKIARLEARVAELEAKQLKI